jgi:hypothetical protein
MATQALMGTPARILLKKDDYYLIQTPDRYIAWTESASLSPKTATEMTRWKSADRVIFIADFGLVYCSPNRNSNPVSDLVAGTILEIDHSKNSIGKFVAVRLPDSREGFVEAEQCRDLTIWSSRQQPLGLPWKQPHDSTWGDRICGAEHPLKHSTAVDLQKQSITTTAISFPAMLHSKYPKEFSSPPSISLNCFRLATCFFSVEKLPRKSLKEQPMSAFTWEIHTLFTVPD